MEQERFIEEFIYIVDKSKADMVIISGDIYDNGNPPAKAERLFYQAVKRLSNEGKRPVIVVAGNHDNPERLVAANPLAYEYGILILGTPKSSLDKGKYGEFEIVDSGEGFIEIEINGERVVLVLLPYPSEKRLNEVFLQEDKDMDRMLTYSEKIGDIFNNLTKKYREDTINIAVSHIFVNGGITSESERSIELGGSLAVNPGNLPEKAQYIALGHLHRPQRVKGAKNAYYSGSPIQYSKSEVGYSKCVYQVDLKLGEEAQVESIYLSNYKPIEIWKCEGVEKAIEMCKENSQRDVWVYLEISTEEYISQEDIKLMNEYKKDIIEIIPKIKVAEENDIDLKNLREKTMEELFKEFYLSQKGTEINEELMDLFISIVNDEDEVIEE